MHGNPMGTRLANNGPSAGLSCGGLFWRSKRPPLPLRPLTFWGNELLADELRVPKEVVRGIDDRPRYPLRVPQEVV